MLAHLSGWERVLGRVRLYRDQQEMDGPVGSTIRFTDVLQRGSDTAVDLTNGKDVSNCQRYLSANGDKVVFIRRFR